MLDTVRKAYLAGIGALDLTEDKVKEFFDELVHRGEVTENEGRELFAAWRKRAAEQRERVERYARDAVQRAMTALELVRRNDLDALEARVAALEQRLERPEREPVDEQC